MPSGSSRTAGAGPPSSPPAARNTTARCPRLILEGGDDADLDPGNRPFRFGATIKATESQIGVGANVMQKGVAGTGSQWKLQIGRRGKASCVLIGRGSARSYMVKSSVRVNDGRWHVIQCRRSGSSLSVVVDNAPSGAVSIPANLSISNALPMRVGGRNLNARSDQFGGALDDVVATLG